MSSREYYQRNREQCLKRARIYRLEHLEQIKKCTEGYKMKRLELLKFLGGKCVRCGYKRDIRALQFDHKEGDGNEERKIRSGYSFWIYYSKHPELARARLQILCCNCNMIKKFERHEWGRNKEKLSAMDELIVKEKL